MTTREQLAQARFSHEVHGLHVCETHLSLVVLTGELAYKIKKAVKLDFIDTTSLETRRLLCEEELRLNRRYAPDLYLRVVPIAAKDGALHFQGHGDAVEFAVQMRQFDASDELQSLVEHDAVSTAEISALADCIATFHQSAAELGAENLSGTLNYLRKVRENLASVTARAAYIRGETTVAELGKWTESTLSRIASRLEMRERQGFVRECHGDLHSRNVVRWKGALLPFDCIEFDPALRFIDVLNDVAFLVMDLTEKGRRDLAYTLLNRYLERTGDYDALELLPSYLVYRALVRVKVELISCEQHPEDNNAQERAKSYMRTALALTSPICKPMLVVMNGASGSGKSWLSEQLVPLLPALRIRSDVERKRLGRMDPFDPRAQPRQDIYTLEFNDRTYSRLLACARECLRAGLTVIVDAAFLKARERRDFAHLARAQNAAFLIVSCSADPDALARRIAERQSARNDPSDADEHIMRRQLQTLEPLESDELTVSIEVDTRHPNSLQRVVDRVRQLA